MFDLRFSIVRGIGEGCKATARRYLNRKSTIDNQKPPLPFPRVETGGNRTGSDQSRWTSRRFPVGTFVRCHKWLPATRFREIEVLGYAGFTLSTDATTLAKVMPKLLAADGLGPPVATDHP